MVTQRATLISDFITLFLIKERKFYAKVKFEEVEVPDVKRGVYHSEDDDDEADKVVSDVV